MIMWVSSKPETTGTEVKKCKEKNSKKRQLYYKNVPYNPIKKINVHFSYFVHLLES